MRAIVPEVQGERAARFHRKTVEALSEIVATVGLKHPSDLRPDHLMHRVGAERAATMDRIFTFLPKGVLLDAPEETVYRDWWNAASAETFRPVMDLERVRAKTENKIISME